MDTVIEQEKIYNILDLCDPRGPNGPSIFDQLEAAKNVITAEALNWSKYNTRYGSRYVSDIKFSEINTYIIYNQGKQCPQVYESIPYSGLINEMFKIANKTVEKGFMIPFQLFVCYYLDGKQVVPMHSHQCRQLTLSIGSDRKMRITNSKGRREELNMYNGSLLYLHGQPHSIIREPDVTEDRISFNLFFTTSIERQGANN